MEGGDTDKSSQGEDMAALNRNRSFKSKQLVRSQAIRETQSPPRTLSPKTPAMDEVPANVRTFCESVVVNSSHSSDKCSVDPGERKTQPVEIQITSNTSWAQESSNQIDQRQRARRWLGTKHYSDSISDLLSNSPRVTCVCGNCKMRPRLDDLGTRICPNCRGRRRKFPCPAKQDSGIVCEEECMDCTDITHRNESLQQKKVENLDKVQMEQTYCSCPVNKEKNNEKLNDFDDKKELTGAELIRFFKETLNKSAKDRWMLLKIEKDLHTFVTDPGRTLIRFPTMSSYHRMLVHRCASLFDLAHGADGSRSVVIVSKCGTSGGRITCTDFNDWCTTAFPEEESGTAELQAKSILKRDALSLDETIGGGNQQCMSARSKSLEQREKEYEQARRRIFSSEMTPCPPDESQWPWLQSGNFKLLTPENGRNKLVKVQSLETPVASQSRGAVSKSHSFGGYEPPPPTRVLSRQGDLASSSWRLSPSSSGYKTLSLRSTDSVTPSPTGDISPEPNSVSQNPNELPLVWAISDVSSIPIGALIIHPQTGCPLTNRDGSLYHYHPANPPVFQDMQVQQNSEQNSEKKRGRLEKQHSFIENEYECQAEVTYDEKCKCSDKLDWGEDRTPEKCQMCEANEKQQNKPEQAPVVNQPQSNVQYKATELPTPVPNNQKLPRNEPANQQPESTFADKNYEQYTMKNQAPKQESVPVSEEVSVDVKTAEAVYDDHSMEQMALQVYSGPMHQANYTYPTQCRMEQHIQQPMYTQMQEEPKVANPALQEPTFRIDPTYPYHPQAIQDVGANVGYVANYGYHLATCNGCCGVDGINGINNCVLSAQRSYAVPYTQNIEASVMQPMANPYPMTNVLLTHQPMQYPYPPSLQYPVMQHIQPPLSKPSPNVYIQQEIPIYPQIENLNQIYPVVYQNYQVPYTLVPQHSMCPVYPLLERERPPRTFEQHKFASKKNSVCGSSRATPLESAQQPAEAKPAYAGSYESKFNKQNSFNEADHRRKPFVRTNSVRSDTQQRDSPNEIAAKIQQIKQQMAQLNTAEKAEKKPYEKPKVFDDRRNRNPGILGSYPNNNQFNRVTRPDETQLNSAARALVNSLRQNLQVKNTYTSDTRRDYHNNGRYYKHDYHDRNYRRDRREIEYANNRDGNSERQDSSNGEVKMQNNYDRNRTPDAERTNHLRLEQHPMHRNRPVNPVTPFYRPFMFRQMTPPWCRRSPAPIPQTYGHPRRPPPDNRNGRRP